MTTRRKDPLTIGVEKWCREEGLLRSGDRVIVAVSGGPDSLALLHVLWSLRRDLDLELRVASLDHGLRREEGRADVRFVGEVAKSLGLDFVAGVADARAAAAEEGLSLEDAARRVRYHFLGQAARDWGPGKAGVPRVAVGHNSDDQAETVLMRIIEGTGLLGLSGMPPAREEEGWVLIRPLLRTSRHEIREYCRRWRLEPREDSTNADPRFRRNQIRNRIMPVLSEYNPRVTEALVRLADLAREEKAGPDQKVEEAVRAVVTPEIPSGEGPFAGLDTSGRPVLAVNKAAFRELPGALKKGLVRWLARDLMGLDAWREFGLGGVERAVKGIERLDVGGRLDLPGRILLEAGYRYAFFTVNAGGRGPARTPAPSLGRREPVALLIPGRTEFKELGWAFDVIRLRAIPSRPGAPAPRQPDGLTLYVNRRATLPLRVRTRRAGDVFRPRGLGGSKKLKDFFISAKVPRAEREAWPILVDGQGEIVWVVGLRGDERFMAATRDEAVIRVKAERLPREE